jgi:hypothetical protein
MEEVEMPDFTIRQMIDSVTKGQIRIPAFQRGFVWDADQVAYFMDSLYKGYPFGSFLFWRTRERLKVERKLGPFSLPNCDPDYPIDYVLDGQQRITSIFGVFQTELQLGEPEDWINVYFDYRADPNAQVSQFAVVNPEEADTDRYFPLRCLFDTTQYRRATRDMEEDIAKRIDELQARFKEIQLPVQTFSTEDRAAVAIVFERVNRKGVELDTLQLLSAWTWSDSFDLHQKFEDLATELEKFGFADVGKDKDLLLRCCAAVLSQDASPDKLVRLDGSTVRARWQEVVNGIKGSVDFLRQEFSIQSLNNLPYDVLLVPLSVFFSTAGTSYAKYNDVQRRTLCKWFWRSCFTKRYSSQTIRNLKNDIEQALRLKNGAKSDLAGTASKVSPDFFTGSTFRADSVNTRATILLLAKQGPLSFISGSPVSLSDVLRESNRSEFHHLFPRAFLAGKTLAFNANCLANFCFLSKSDNIQLGGVAPSEYKKKMSGNQSDILQRALCPPELFQDDFDSFIPKRAELLANAATKLMK